VESEDFFAHKVWNGKEREINDDTTFLVLESCVENGLKGQDQAYRNSKRVLRQSLRQVTRTKAIELKLW
jgi:hypothetical protein